MAAETALSWKYCLRCFRCCSAACLRAAKPGLDGVIVAGDFFGRPFRGGLFLLLLHLFGLAPDHKLCADAGDALGAKRLADGVRGFAGRESGGFEHAALDQLVAVKRTTASSSSVSEIPPLPTMSVTSSGLACARSSARSLLVIMFKFLPIDSAKCLKRPRTVGNGVFLLRRKLGIGLFKLRQVKYRVVAEAAVPLGANRICPGHSPRATILRPSGQRQVMTQTNFAVRRSAGTSFRFSSR